MRLAICLLALGWLGSELVGMAPNVGRQRQRDAQQGKSSQNTVLLVVAGAMLVGLVVTGFVYNYKNHRRVHPEGISITHVEQLGELGCCKVEELEATKIYDVLDFGAKNLVFIADDVWEHLANGCAPGGAWADVRKISLAHNPINQLPEQLRLFKVLPWFDLDLSVTRIRQLPEWLGELPIRRLYINDTQIAQLPRSLVNVRELRHIYMEACAVSDAVSWPTYRDWFERERTASGLPRVIFDPPFAYRDLFNALENAQKVGGCSARAVRREGALRVR